MVVWLSERVEAVAALQYITFPAYRRSLTVFVWPRRMIVLFEWLAGGKTSITMMLIPMSTNARYWCSWNGDGPTSPAVIFWIGFLAPFGFQPHFLPKRSALRQTQRFSSLWVPLIEIGHRCGMFFLMELPTKLWTANCIPTELLPTFAPVRKICFTPTILIPVSEFSLGSQIKKWKVVARYVLSKICPLSHCSRSGFDLVPSHVELWQSLNALRHVPPVFLNHFIQLLYGGHVKKFVHWRRADLAIAMMTMARTVRKVSKEIVNTERPWQFRRQTNKLMQLVFR